MPDLSIFARFDHLGDRSQLHLVLTHIMEGHEIREMVNTQNPLLAVHVFVLNNDKHRAGAIANELSAVAAAVRCVFWANPVFSRLLSLQQRKKQ